ncbi:HEPN domain-containing protein [Parendozoicomonas haliclonae]|uniref:Uncharacterized protein n=1 Tax=Parendozoicomonas haliclonae TaxID=1960125 RepID=A0A1X7AQH3_9GAMM|nr:HEPN domain-containing protein [Parendozoicomonas haliclonae]SMA50403.1 hypothetical protein EHSB41UT_04201 [Parendozoicomonas haliclonae]
MDTIAQEIKATLRAVRDDLEPDLALRLHRANSWLAATEALEDDFIDMGFVSLWIGFNTCYGEESDHTQELTERQRFRAFVESLCECDLNKHIYHCLWRNFTNHVRRLLKNQYVYAGFWKAQREGTAHWEEQFHREHANALKALAAQDVPKLLGIVLDRLYVLRNQLVHGGATFQSGVNREQVNDGHAILKALLPIIIQIMMNSNDRDWGPNAYPVINT